MQIKCLLKKLCKLLKGKVRKSKDKIKKRHKDIAAALQIIYEEVIIKILNHIYDNINQETKTKCENVVLSGGCALNSVANGKILSNTKFSKMWVLPDPGDGGTSVGCSFIYLLFNT
jgi:carbamoyltransferase